MLCSDAEDGGVEALHVIVSVISVLHVTAVTCHYHKYCVMLV